MELHDPPVHAPIRLLGPFHVEHDSAEDDMTRMNGRGYFVTGTDTGVGKTHVTATLAIRARALHPGQRVFAFKPIETGCAGAYGEDQEVLAVAAGDWQQQQLRGMYRLRQPAAPLVAAEAEASAIDVPSIVETFRAGSEGTTVALVEGAGGWRVPITPTVDIGGLAVALGLPVIVVARATLGTINHSLLTIEAVEREGCSVAALVLSQRPNEDAAFATSNARTLARRWAGRIIVFAAESNVLDPLLD